MAMEIRSRGSTYGVGTTASRSEEDVLLGGANLPGGGVPAVKRRGRRRRGARRRVVRKTKNEEETMRCGGGFAGREGYLYQQIRCNRRSHRTAPSDCLFGFNGVDAVAV